MFSLKLSLFLLIQVFEKENCNSHHERLISSRTYNEERSRFVQDSKAQDEDKKDFHGEVTDSFKPQEMTEAFYLFLGPCTIYEKRGRESSSLILWQMK